MARPRKPEGERRCKWPVLYVTAAERATIQAAADDAGLSVNAYLLSSAQRARIVSPLDGQQAARYLGRIDARLGEIAGAVVSAPISASQSVALLLALRNIESQVATWDGGAEETFGPDRSGSDGKC